MVAHRSSAVFAFFSHFLNWASAGAAATKNASIAIPAAASCPLIARTLHTGRDR